MKIRALLCAALAFSMVYGSTMAYAAQDETEASGENQMISSLMPQPVLDLIGGKTFQARVSGYGWGESAETLKFDITACEPMLFSAEAVESLKPGDSIDAGMDIYTVKTIQDKDDSMEITPEEMWLTLVVFRINEDGNYTAEDGNGILTVDSFSFSCRVRPDLVYINEEGDSLTAQDLMDALSEGAIDTSAEEPQMTFDEEGYLTQMDFSK